MLYCNKKQTMIKKLISAAAQRLGFNFIYGYHDEIEVAANNLDLGSKLCGLVAVPKIKHYVDQYSKAILKEEATLKIELLYINSSLAEDADNNHEVVSDLRLSASKLIQLLATSTVTDGIANAVTNFSTSEGYTSTTNIKSLTVDLVFTYNPYTTSCSVLDCKLEGSYDC